MKNKQVVLLINGIAYFFPFAFVEDESYHIGSSVQLPTKSESMPIITPNIRTASITLAIPTGEWKNRQAYKTAKEIIRITQFMFAQRDYQANDQYNSHHQYDLNGSQKTSYQSLGSKITIPFTNLQMPWQIQIACAYIGINIQLSCCILSSFSVSTSYASCDVEMWNIGLCEYDISQIRSQPKNSIQNAPLVGHFLDPVPSV